MKTKRDGQTDGGRDGRTGGVVISPVPGLRRFGAAGDKYTIFYMSSQYVKIYT